MKLNARAFGLAVGIFAGGFWVVAMGLSLLTGLWAETVKTLGGLHPGFSYSWPGLIQIAVMHLIGGFVLGWLFARCYNWLAKSDK